MLVGAARTLDLSSALAAFARDGYSRLGTALDEDYAARLRARIDDLMLGRVVHEGLFFQLDAPTGRYDDLRYGFGYEGPSLSYRKLEKLEKDPLFLPWIENPLFERVARELIAGEIVLYRAVVFNKAAHGGSPLPWHQDGGSFWGVDRAPTVQLWTALDDAPLEAGGLEVVPGTHAGGLVTPQGGVVPPNRATAKDAEARAVALPARTGEVILLHNHLWHRSGTNVTDHPRRTLSVCYMSAATRCLRKKRAPREFFPVFRSRTSGGEGGVSQAG